MSSRRRARSRLFSDQAREWSSRYWKARCVCLWLVLCTSDEQTLAVAGTFTLVPLQHSVSLLSTTLHPAENDVESYPVFAPTCHPLPVITPVVNPDQLACSLALEDVELPKTFLRDASRAIFLLQENRTGIEGLSGDVVPGFNNIWAGDKGVWGLMGVHPVSSAKPTSG